MPLERHLCRFQTETNLVAQILTTQNWDRSISYVTQVYVSLPPTSGTRPCTFQRNVAQNLRFEIEKVSRGADCDQMAMLDIAGDSNLHNLCACEKRIGVQLHKNKQTAAKCQSDTPVHGEPQCAKTTLRTTLVETCANCKPDLAYFRC